MESCSVGVLATERDTIKPLLDHQDLKSQLYLAFPLLAEILEGGI